MACYPQIATPCPVADRLDEILDRGFCARCREHVVDLDALRESERYALMARTGGGQCVRYRLPALAAAAMVVGVAALPAAAQDSPPPVAVAGADAEMDDIIVGGAVVLTDAERKEMRFRARQAERWEEIKRRRAERAARADARISSPADPRSSR